MPKRTSKPTPQKTSGLGIEQPFAYDVEFCEGFVLGDLVEVSKKLAKLAIATEVVSVDLQQRVPVGGLVYCLIQVQSERWVRVLAPFYHFTYFTEGLLMALSKVLKTKAISWFFEDTAFAFGYTLFSNGSRMESLEVLPDAPCVFRSRLPQRKGLKPRPGKEELFVSHFFAEQEIYVRRGFDYKITEGHCVVKGPKLKAQVGVHLVDVPAQRSW